MNSWKARCLAVAFLLLAMWAHHACTARLDNTPAHMLLYHGSAALLDLSLLYTAPSLLRGGLCRDTQKLLLASIVGNFAGWLLYMAYVSPRWYDGYMWALTYAQLFRFSLPDRHADLPGLNLVRHSHSVGGGDFS